LSPARTAHKILFIEDGAELCERLRAAFSQSGSRRPLEFASTIVAGIDVLQRELVDVVVVNQALAGDNTPDLLRRLNTTGKATPVILITARSDEEATLQALREGLDECVSSDVRSVDFLPFLVERVIARAEAEREEAESSHAIIRSQKQWMAIIDAITDYIFVLDNQHRLVRVNNAFATAFGMHPKEVLGRQCGDLFGADISNKVDQGSMLRDGGPRIYEKTIGDNVYQISIFPLQENDQALSIHVMKNISEVKRLKDQLYHSDKLASIGLLVSGVAHEINNPLTGAIAYTELLAMKVADESIKPDLKKILDSAERCKRIVDNLLTFSRQKTPSKSLESVNSIIDRAVDLRGYWLKSSNIEVVKCYDTVSTVYVDAQQIQQVILNMLLNAEQTIVAAGIRSGRITFTTRYERDNRRVVITVADNGPGIPQKIMSKIFDPFFTTKPVGVGTGLGLSISHGIIAEHGGTIRAGNVEGGGAAFTIELPTGTVALQGAPDFKESERV